MIKEFLFGITSALAEEAGAAAADAAAAAGDAAGEAVAEISPIAAVLQMVLPLVAMGAIFYFMLIRPQRRREKERRALLDAVKTGDRILFAGGLIGTVANVKDKTLLVKLADNVKIEVARAAVAQILTKDSDPNAEDGKTA